MTLKITRVSPGHYETVANDVRFYIADIGHHWVVTCGAPHHPAVITTGPTKKAVVSSLEIYLRSTKDRTKSNSHKIARRSELTKGTELTLERGALRGSSGRVRFIGYTKTQGGVEWLDVVDSKGRSRAVDPAKVKTVHRDRKMI